MPIIRSAKKKVRKDKKRTLHNKSIKQNLKGLIKNMRKNPSTKTFQELTSKLDKAVKVKIIHQNKASRLKSKLSKLVSKALPATKTKVSSAKAR